MIFYIFIFIVFISEIIIALFTIFGLLRINNRILELNRFLYEVKPKIKEISELGTKISEQMIEFANLAVEKVQDYALEFAAKYFKGILTGLLIWSIKRKIKNY